MNCTVDASVFVAAARSVEAESPASVAFLEFAQLHEMRLLCPSLVFPECAAAVARPTGDEALAQTVIADLQRLSTLHVITIDLPLAQRAARIAIAQRLRGADSIYVAVAQTFAATLVTWDSEMLERAGPAAVALTPSDWLEHQEAGGPR